MANKIDILINMVKQGHGDEEAFSGLKKLSSGFESLTGVSLSAAGAMGLAAGAIKFMGDAVSETVDYAMDVKDFSMALGVTSEEASKLIQIGDDLRVSQESMAMAFRFALDKGITPNIEGLADLSEQMLAMEDPAERMQMAIDVFGSRAGMEMMKILEQGPDAIREMADELEGSALVMSGDAVEAADEYRLKLDELNDMIEGAKIRLGTDLVNALNAVSDAMEDTSVNTDVLKKALDEGLITEQQYKIMFIALKNGSLEYVDALALLEQKRNDLAVAQEAARPGDEAAISRGRDAAEAARDHALANDELADATDDLAKSQAILYGAMDETTGKFDEARITQDLLGKAIQSVSDDMIEQQKLTLELAAAMGTMTEAEIAEREQALLRIENLAELNRMLDDGAISWEGYVQVLEDGQITQQEVIDLIGAETLGLYNLRGAAEAAAGAYKLSFEIDVYGDDIPGLGNTGAYSYNIVEAASGANFVVPPGYPNDSFTMGLTSGEYVQVTPSSEVNNYYNLTLNEAGSRGNVVQDFALLKSLAAV